MTTSSNDAAFWSKTSRKYAASPIRDLDGYNNTLARTKSYLGHDDAVLEIGCGTGSTAFLLAPFVGHITATDFSPGMIDIAKEKLEAEALGNVTFKVEDVLEYSSDNGPFDAVLAHNLLHLLRDLDSALSRLSSMTKTGGIFISKTVCAPQKGQLKYWILSKVVIPGMQAVGKAPFVDFLPPQYLDQKIAAAGFEILETIDQVGMLPSRYIVARKL